MTERGHVLIVEDDTALRDVYAEALRDEGWSVSTAEDGLVALAELESGPEPCAAIIDLRMPRMDGWELMERLRNDRRWGRLPVVIVAAHYRIHDEARELGVGWWLQKPITIEQLLGVVSEACASGKAA